MENAIDYKELLEHGIATKDFVRAEINSVRTEIKASETRMIQWFIGTAIALTLAMLGIQNLLVNL